MFLPRATLHSVGPSISEDTPTETNTYHTFAGGSSVQYVDTFLFIGGMKEVDPVPQCSNEIFQFDGDTWKTRPEILSGDGRANMAAVRIKEDQLPDSCRKK